VGKARSAVELSPDVRREYAATCAACAALARASLAF
jgi:hypothetical protein